MTLTLKEITEKGLWQKVKELRQIAPDATPETYTRTNIDTGFFPPDELPLDQIEFTFTPEEAEYLGLKETTKA